MSLEYAEQKIQQALKLSKGNQARARQQVIAWALEDDALLKALTRSHLTGIVAYNIERVASGRAAAARVASQKATPKKQAAQKGKNQEGDFGVELLKAVASSSTEIFGLENGSAGIGRPKGVSQSHINAIRAIASNKKKS